MRIMQKSGISFMLAMFIMAVCHAGPAADVNWQNDYASALKTAAAAKKNILLLFTGSDWCPACKSLEQQILNSAEFKTFANENLIAVLVDFPRIKKLTEAQVQSNEALQKKFCVKAYPTVILLDAGGNVLEEFGYSGQTPEAFIIELNRARMMVPRREPVPPLEGKRAPLEVVKFYDSIVFPPKGKSADNWSYLRKCFDFYKLRLVTEPLNSGAIKQNEADWITAMLTRYFWQPGYLKTAELEKSGREIYLKENAAVSSYFLACYLWTLSEQDAKFRHAVMEAASRKLLADKKLPALLHMIYNHATGGEIVSLLNQAIVSGELDKAPPQFIYRMLTEHKNTAATLKPTLLLLEKSKIDTWIARMIAAQIELNIAWKARGGGYAYTVKENGWKEFNEHSELAYKYLEEAWKMHPEWPEAAGLLVYVACGLDGNDMVQWFNRTVAAQIDYTPAYEYLFWGLRPRWHGSWHIMLAVGQKAADMDDTWYYTLAPLAFVWAVQDIAGEMDIVRRRAFLREQLPNVRRVLEKKIAADRRNNNWVSSRHMYAILTKHLLLCGDYAGAKAALANVAPGDNGCNTLSANNYLTDFWRTMELEIALATGPSAGIIKQIDTAIDVGEIEKAARLYLSLITSSSTPMEYIFLEYRVARLFILDCNTAYSKDRGIFILARYGSIPGVRVFLDAKYDVNMRGKDNCTLLQRSLTMDGSLMDDQEAYAASKISMLKFLLSRGAEINALSEQKWTAQHLAVSNKLPVKVLEFIAQQPGIDLNAGDVNVQTPLMWCAMLDLPEHAQFLIKQGADINRRDNKGKTALDYATSDRMRQLLQNAAKPR
ncbi:MAG: ankyrin repeat domain-containing protein [Victivallaceae bacterium]